MMSSTRPYLIRCFYNWISDNDCTPYIVVNTEIPDVEVPEDYIEGDQIVLNISEDAVRDLEINNDAIEFRARFGAEEYNIFVPAAAVVAIYARENGRGMVFAEDEGDEPPPDREEDGSDGVERGKAPYLKVVK